MEALKRWLDTKSDFEEAALKFLEACNRLKDVVESGTSYVSEIAHQVGFQEIKSYPTSFEKVLGYIEQSKRVLNVISSISSKRVSIKMLPTAVLGRIFSILIASSTCMKLQTPKPLQDALCIIPLVCRDWHRVLKANPAFWTHIDLRPSKILKNRLHNGVVIGLERSYALPIHLHIPKIEMCGTPEIVGLPEALQPHMNRICSITIHNDKGYHSNNTCDFILRPVLSLFSSYGNRDILRVLVVCDITLMFNFPLLWPTGPFSQLVELRLEDLYGPACPSLRELVSLISCSPALHTLQLRRLDLHVDHQGDYPEFQLPQLRLLDIMSIHANRLSRFANLINIGPYQLHVRVDLDTLNVCEIQRLLSRCAVAALTVRGVRPVDVYDLSGTVPNLNLASVPNLRVLILCVHYGHEKQIIAGLLNYLTKNDTAGRLPRLEVLMLKSGRIQLSVEEILEKVLEKLELRNLVLVNTRFGETALKLDSDSEEDDAGEIPEKLKRLVVSRGGKVIELDKYPVQIDYEVDQFVQELAGRNYH